MVRNLDVSRAEQLLRRAETASAAFLDALTDEIAIVDSAGTIIAVNDAWKRFPSTEGDSGFEAPGVGQNYLDVCERSAAAGVEDARKVLDGLRGVLRKTANQFLTEYEFVSPQSRRWFLLTATALAQMPGALVSHRDITGARKAEEALRLGGRNDAGGPLYDSFLPALVKNLSAALGVRHAFVVEVIDGKTRAARLLAHWDGVSFEESREYTISGLPSEQVLEGRTSIFPSGVRRLFPDDELLARMEAESYMAVPLLDSRGDPLGYLGILDTKPIEDVSFAETTLRVFASPATPELERRRVQRRLEEQSRLIYYTADAVVGTDTDFVITYWNNAARELYGWPKKKLLAGLPGMSSGQSTRTRSASGP
jgi:PAS domain-containing protein